MKNLIDASEICIMYMSPDQARKLLNQINSGNERHV